MKPTSLLVLAVLISAHVLPGISQQNRSTTGPSDGPIMPNASPRVRPERPAPLLDLSAARTVLGDAVSVQASGRGRPRINFGDGHDLLGSYSGDASLVSQLQANQARPVSLAAADLDGDGVPDLLSGFAAQSGGIISVSRGNVDSIYPNSRQALARKNNGTFTDAPFLSPARLFELPSAPDFIEAGDFDAEGFVDVAAASRGSDTIFLLSGDGGGGLGAPKSIKVPGRITAMASGDVNRRDGLTDLIVGVNSDRGPLLLVFEGAQGALNSVPEIIHLPVEASSIGVGYLFNNTFVDIAVAAGRFLVAVHGRDRKLSMSPGASSSVEAPTVSRLALPSPAAAITLGRFTGTQGSQAALLLKDGRLELAGTGGVADGKLLRLGLTSVAEGGAGPQPRLLRAHVSSSAGDDLIVLDQAASRLRVMTGPNSISGSAVAGAPALMSAPIDLDVDGPPVAALPMRLNRSARNDLVVIRRGSVNASVVPAQFNNVFTVTSTEDDVGAGGPQSQPQQEGTTLRDSVTAAINAGPGTSNEIIFNIPAQAIPIINLAASLPTLSAANSVTVDGFTQAAEDGVAMVEINGQGHNAFSVPGSGNVIAALVINNSTAALQLTGGSNNIIEGNFIGTAADGVTTTPNTGPGVMIAAGSDNMVGGTSVDASNVIGGNTGDGVTITNAATGTTLLGNFIGTDAATHTMSVANGGNGLSIENGAAATSIGASPGINYFSFNALDGVFISSGANHLIQDNGVQGNLGHGLLLAATSTTTIGGSQTSGAQNGIWQNHLNGILIETGSTAINTQGNSIGVGFLSSGQAVLLGNTMDGVSISASGNLVGGATANLGNNIAFNGGDGVGVLSGNDNGILSNVIAANPPGLPIHLFPGTNDNAQPPAISGAALTPSVSTSAAAVSIKSAVVVQTSSPVMVISFAFTSTPNQTFDMQFYVPQICNCTNCFTSVGIYSTQVTTDAQGNAPPSVSITLTATPAAGSFVNGTATDASDSTSEFSECVEIGSSSACEYTLSAPSEEISASGGSGSFNVITSAACPFTASDPDSFVHITSGSGLGNGAVTFTVDANSGTSSRTSTITVASGVTFTVIEDGVGPDFSLTLTPGTISGTPGTVIPVTVGINRSGGFTSPVVITPPAKANGIKPKPGTTKKLKGSNLSYTLNIKITGSAVPGTYQFTFSATGAGLTGTRTATLNVTVQ
jgi:hypothetical protein